MSTIVRHRSEIFRSNGQLHAVAVNDKLVIKLPKGLRCAPANVGRWW